MKQDAIVFQLATHYLTKISLRIERLFFAIEEACHEHHPIIHHYALKNIIEIIKLIEKPELKSRFLKEMMRMEHILPKTPLGKIDNLYAKLYVQVQVLNHLAGRFGDTIHLDPFLQSIRLAQTAHTNDCELHAPQLLFWLDKHAVKRQHDLKSWLKHLQSLGDTVNVYLGILREIAQYETMTLNHGFYQQSLPMKALCHLILLRINKEYNVVPKMQIGHHGLSLSFSDAYTMQEVKISLSFDLAICQI